MCSGVRSAAPLMVCPHNDACLGDGCLSEKEWRGNVRRCFVECSSVPDVVSRTTHGGARAVSCSCLGVASVHKLCPPLMPSGTRR